MISYIAESFLFQLIFLSIFQIVFRRQTFFGWNRALLLGSLILSLLIPLIELEKMGSGIQGGSVFQVLPDAIVYLEGIQIFKNEGSTSMLSWVQWVWIFGALLSLSWFFFRLRKITCLHKACKRGYEKGIPIMRLHGEMQSFTFLNWIFLGDQLPKNSLEAVLEHERTHVRLFHSVDILFLELLQIPFWFNPLFFWYKKVLTEVHEFQADASAIRYGRKMYYNELLSQAFRVPGMHLVHTFFNSSLLKNRITMLQKKSSPNAFKLSYLLVVPILGIMLWMSACRDSNETTIQVPFAAIDEVPVYPGCEDASNSKACFMEQIQKHVRKNFKYPEKAVAQGIEGRVNAIFVIGADGRISDVNTKGPHTLLEDEVQRIILRLPKMEPGRHEGRPVDVPFSIPVVFRLDS